MATVKPKRGLAVLRTIDCASIVLNAIQPRVEFGQLDALAASIADVDVLQPIVVQPIFSGGYRLVAGERRLRALKQAGCRTTTAIVRDFDSQADALLAMGDENLLRLDLHAIERGRYFDQLAKPLAAGGAGMTHQQIAARYHKTRTWVTNAIRLLALPPDWQRRIIANGVNETKARALLPYADDADVMQAIAIELESNPELWRTRRDFIDRTAAIADRIKNGEQPTEQPPVLKLRKPPGPGPKIVTLVRPYEHSLPQLKAIRDHVNRLIDRLTKAQKRTRAAASENTTQRGPSRRLLTAPE